MREMRLVEILSKEQQPVSKVSLMNTFQLSESSITRLIQSTKDLGEKYGFQIQYISKKGYVLIVTSKELFQRKCKQISLLSDVYNREERIHQILALILQAQNFITINEIANELVVSRNTIVNDLKIVEKEIKPFALTLERKRYYGLRFVGSELAYRRAFSKYVLGRYPFLFVEKFQAIRKPKYLKQLKDLLRNLLEEKDINYHEVALRNIVRHLMILIYRGLGNHFLSERMYPPVVLEDRFLEIAYEIKNWIYKNYLLKLPNEEVEFLAIHLAGKTSTPKVDPERKGELSKQLLKILIKLDEEFLTTFRKDSILLKDLLLHMLPLLNRLFNNIQLENPLIDEIYSKHANVFLIAVHFNELMKKEYNISLSRDEIGYVAVHFAAHFERRKIKALEFYKRVAVICESGGGSSKFLRLKLQSVFPKAHIIVETTRNLERFHKQLPNIFLSTIPMDTSFHGVPIVQIDPLLEEESLNQLKRMAENLYIHGQINDLSDIPKLFSKELFFRTKEKDYLKLLKRKANTLVSSGYATEGFVESVLERERKFSTIYENGVAGPHGMKLTAQKDCVAVTILEEPIFWKGKLIKIIFLINLKPGHIFLHRELSKLIPQIINNNCLRNRLMKATTFEEFMFELNYLL